MFANDDSWIVTTEVLLEPHQSGDPPEMAVRVASWPLPTLGPDALPATRKPWKLPSGTLLPRDLGTGLDLEFFLYDTYGVDVNEHLFILADGALASRLRPSRDAFATEVPPFRRAPNSAASVLSNIVRTEVVVPVLGSPPKDWKTLGVLATSATTGTVSSYLASPEGLDAPLMFFGTFGGMVVMVEIVVPVARAVGDGVAHRIRKWFGLPDTDREA